MNQTANLILAEALGVELTAHQITDTTERQRRDQHGEYARQPGRRPVDFIVVENLSRYLTSIDRPRGENSRLMQWSHRAILTKLKELAQGVGLAVVEVPAAFSSRYCAYTGRPGLRARAVHAAMAKEDYWQSQIAKDPAIRDHFAALAELERAPLKNNRPHTLLMPRDGGELFVPIVAHEDDAKHVRPCQADLNAAANIGLRAIAGPDCFHARVRWPIGVDVRPDGSGTPVPRAKAERNKLEIALWTAATLTAAPWSKRPEGDRWPATLFADPEHLAGFERAILKHDGRPDITLATGKALWSRVKALAWKRINAINCELLQSKGRLTPAIKALLVPTATPPDLDFTDAPEEF